MEVSKNIRINVNGGVYAAGKSLSEGDWVQMYLDYQDILNENDGKCTCRALAVKSRRCTETAHKAISHFQMGLIPPAARRGHRRRGNGTMKDLNGEHHQYIYDIYIRHPERSRESYVRSFYKEFRIEISVSFVTNWFKTIGPFQGNLRLTSRFPPKKYTWQTNELLDEYVLFISSVRRLSRLVFADEKPFKGLDIYCKVRRDPFTGVVPDIRCDANCRNRYNILAAISLKENHPICARVIDLHGDAIVFREFVADCIEEGVLQHGDIFIVDNCTIHCYGDNSFLQEILWQDHGILMITLPPYHPELNPTELIFRAIVTKLRSWRANEESFELDDITVEVTRILYQEMTPLVIQSFYRESSYF